MRLGSDHAHEHLPPHSDVHWTETGRHFCHLAGLQVVHNVVPNVLRTHSRRPSLSKDNARHLGLV